jgi:ABC-type branched-subunit amino acid transport system permease subunit
MLFSYISIGFNRLRNLKFEYVYLGANIASALVAIFAIISSNTLAIGLQFIIIIFLLLQTGLDYDEKYINSQKFKGVLINFIGMMITFYAVGYNTLASEVMIYVAFYAIAGLSLNMSTGLVGVLNFGVIAQIAVGSVTYAVLTVNHDVPIILATLAAMLVSAIFSGLIALTTLRLRDDYFAIVSITLGEIFRQILKTEVTLRGPLISGDFPTTPGIFNIPIPLKGPYQTLMKNISGFEFAGYQILPDDLLETYTDRFLLGILGLVLLGLSYWFITRLIYSPYGRLLKSIREDELVTSTYGKDIFRYKVEVMTISGALAGLAGAYTAWIFPGIFPENFLPTVTFFIWTVFIIGGRGSNKGIIVGAIAFTLLERMSLFFNNQEGTTVNVWINSLNDLIHSLNENAPEEIAMAYLQLSIIGLVLVLFIRFAPRGLIPEEAYRPSIRGIRLPEPGSQSEDQKGIAEKSGG